MRLDLLAQIRSHGIDQAALDAVRCGHAFTLQCVLYAIAILPVCNDGLERRTCMTLHEMRAPVDIEAAVSRYQGRNRNAVLLQCGLPLPIGTELRPAAATQRQHDGICVALDRAGGCIET